ncbi:MAG: hypothetical protein GF350_07265 [Chitinivibrionales bacterium]|nr:hypothetical protein [Chitinivibrionales bacterium]
MRGQMFSTRNFKLFGLSIALLALGYLLLGQGPVENHLSWSVAPAILVIVYCALIPYAILAQGTKEKRSKENTKQGV